MEYLKYTVGFDTFRDIVAKFSATGVYGADTETSGLRVHHGDRLFSLILSNETEQYYFNFQKYEGFDKNLTLDRELIRLLKPIFANPKSFWYMAWARYDLQILAREGIEVAGEVHCTRAQGLVEYNEHMSYSLDACAQRIGMEKDDAVENYIKKHGLTSKFAIPGKKQRGTLKDFTRVPPEIIIPYGLKDAEVCRAVGESQKANILKISAETPQGLPNIRNVYENEKRLTKTLHRMECNGLRIDIPFVKRALEFEQDKVSGTEKEFLALAGEPYSASPKLFARVFADQKEKWKYTEKGNPSFEGAVIERFDSPIAKLVQSLRQSKSRLDFFNGFLYHVDSRGFIHPILNQDGAGHGRFSSSDPNCQNLKSNDEDDAPLTPEEREYQVRRAFIAEDGYFCVAMDYKQMEYRLALDQAGEQGMIRKILETGADPHQLVADDARVTRQVAKKINFGLLYGEGEGLLAENLGVTRDVARALKYQVLGATPKVAEYNQGIMQVAKVRGWIFNWFGRRCHFPPGQQPYRALNYAIAGGSADIVKIGMNRIDEFLLPHKSKMIWNVHDENWLKCYYGEEWIIPIVKKLMEEAYPHKFLPMECSVEYSEKSFGDLVEWESSRIAS